jgi:hypothetical protein
MSNIANIKAKIEALKSGEKWLWPESDYGKALAWRCENKLFLFEIPIFGGEPMYHNDYDFSDTDINKLIFEVESWT